MSQDRFMRWELLASVVAGRPVPLTATATGVAFSDGTGIHLPPDCPPETVMVQAAMIGAGSFTPLGVRLLAGRRGSTERYLALEARRAVERVAGVLPSALVREVSGLHPGPVSPSAQVSLERARRERIPSAPRWCGAIRPLRLRADTAGGPGGEVSDQDMREADQARDSLEELDAIDDSGDGDRSRLMELLATPLSNPMANRLARMLGMGTSPGASGDGGQEFTISGGRAGAGHGGGRQVPGEPPAGASARAGRRTGRRYDEWCRRAGTYRRDWCTVTELLPDTTDRHAPPAVVDVALARQIARLGLADARHCRQPDGDALDTTALTEYATDRRLGHPRTGRLHEDRRKTRRDLGVLVLLDVSGSTDTGSGASRVFEQQRQLADALTGALDRLGDRVATYAFYSRGRDQVRYLRIKEFDQRYDQNARRRLAALEPGGYTRLGAAVRHATHLLATSAGTTNTLLLVIGDGLPYDDGYEHDHAREDTRRALAEAVERGVGCACLSLRAASRAEDIAAVWGQVAHRVLDRPRDLAVHVRPLFRHALAEAAASRRPATRPGRAA